MPLKTRSMPSTMPIIDAPVSTLFHIMKARITPSTPESSIQSEPPIRAADFADAEIFDDLRHAVDEEVRREQHAQRHDARERMREEYDARRDGYDSHEGLLPRAVARAHRAEGTEGAAEAERRI